ncbi:hypothetical protein GBA52_019830 [Prunus armeniaca]|nr:hypothetical protein GBA52_019830 [Prunus armeniaca]
MEKKDHKVACATGQQPEANDILSKEDQSQPNVTLFTQSTKTDSPSNGNAPSLNHQYPSTLQWPYTPQHGVEQSPFMPRPFIATQAPLPGVINQWPQFPHLQQNASNHQVPQGLPPTNYSQSAAPLWLPQRAGYTLPGLNAPATFPSFIAFGATDTSWQTPAAVGGGTSTTNQAQVPNFCYPVGYPYPGFPGPCDPSWWGQGQGQAQHPLCTYAFPGGYFTSAPALPPSCTTPLGQSFQKGIIRPPTKLSQKHQQLWDAQSAENVQLWNVINHLQSEIMDYKNSLLRLEVEVSSLKLAAEVPSLKPAAEEPTAQVSVAVLSGQPSKRGRPKRSVASVDALPSPGESHRRTRGRKPAACKIHQFEMKQHVFEKVILNKVEDKEKAYHSTAAAEQGNNISNVVAHSGGSLEVNGSNSMMPEFHYQFQQDLPNVQMYGIGHTASSEMKGNDDKGNYLRTNNSITSQQTNGTSTKTNLGLHMGAIGTASIGWPSSISSEPDRNKVNIGSQGFYNSGSVIRRGGKIIPGWSFVSEEDASEKLEDAVLGSGKDDNDENMGDDSSSGGEEIARTKDENAHNMDGSREGTSPNWS